MTSKKSNSPSGTMVRPNKIEITHEHARHILAEGARRGRVVHGQNEIEIVRRELARAANHYISAPMTKPSGQIWKEFSVLKKAAKPLVALLGGPYGYGEELIETHLELDGDETEAVFVALRCFAEPDYNKRHGIDAEEREREKRRTRREKDWALTRAIVQIYETTFKEKVQSAGPRCVRFLVACHSVLHEVLGGNFLISKDAASMRISRLMLERSTN